MRRFADDTNGGSFNGIDGMYSFSLIVSVDINNRFCLFAMDSQNFILLHGFGLGTPNLLFLGAPTVRQGQLSVESGVKDKVDFSDFHRIFKLQLDPLRQFLVRTGDPAIFDRSDSTMHAIDYAIGAIPPRHFAGRGHKGTAGVIVRIGILDANDIGIVFQQALLQVVDGFFLQLPREAFVLDAHRGGGAGGLAQDAAGSHHPGAAERDMRGADVSSGKQQIFYVFRI